MGDCWCALRAFGTAVLEEATEVSQNYEVGNGTIMMRATS